MHKNEQKSSLKRDAAWVYAGYFLRYFSLIILIPYYGRVLGPISYGKVLTAMSLMNIVWMTVNYGLSTIGTREIARTSNYEERSRIFSRQIVARIILMPLGILVGGVGISLSPLLAANPEFGIMATIQGILAAFNLGWFFQGIRQFRTSIAVEALSYPLTIFFVLWLVRNQNDGANVLKAQIFTSILCLSTAYCLSRKSSWFVFTKLKSGLREIKHSSVIFMASISAMIMTTGSVYVLSLLSTPAEVGYFGSAERFASLGLSLLMPMGQILMPLISNFHADNSHKAFDLARKALILEVSYGILVLICGVLLTPFVLPFIMGRAYTASVPVLQILVCMFPFVTLGHALGLYVVIPLRKEKMLIITTTIALIVNLIVAVVAVKAWGACGMAGARVCGEAVSSCLLLFMVIRSGMMTQIIRLKWLTKPAMPSLFADKNDMPAL